jgi:hypothetical protein
LAGLPGTNCGLHENCRLAEAGGRNKEARSGSGSVIEQVIYELVPFRIGAR